MSLLKSVSNLQVGAAFAVLLTPRAEGSGLPLELQAAKCRMLHAEPAAGALGILALSTRIKNHVHNRVMLQLRTLNPHVASAFQVCFLDPHCCCRFFLQSSMQDMPGRRLCLLLPAMS